MFSPIYKTSRGKIQIFHSISLHNLHINIRVVYWTLSCCADLSYFLCLIMFVFLRAELCYRLPSNSTSQWTLLPFASSWLRQAPTVDLHHLDLYHARHTQKSQLSFKLVSFLYLLVPNFKCCNTSYIQLSRINCSFKSRITIIKRTNSNS